MLHLLDLTPKKLDDWFARRGLPAYRARQLRRWIFARRAERFDQMTDLPAELREQLAAELRIWTTRVAAHQKGGVGFITHVSNFWPAFPLKIWNLLQDGAFEEAQAEYDSFKEPWRAWTSKVVRETEGEGPFIKAAMDEVGLHGGAPRAPARPVSDALRRELREIFAAAGVPRVGAPTT